MRAFPNLSEEQELAIKAEARKKCWDDLHYLAKEVLGYNRITDHYHKQMAMDIDTPKYRFKLLLHPRGHFKSTIGTEARSVHKLIRNPNARILITNVKLDNSRKFLRAISHHFDGNPRFKWLFRDWWINSYATQYHRAEYGKKLDWVTRNTQDEFTLIRPYAGREASITTGAVDASLVSQHYSDIIADDLVSRDYVRTIDMVERSILYFKDLLDLLDPDGNLEIIGTRWAHMDLYQWIITEFGGKASLRVPQDYLPGEVMERSNNTPEEEKDWMISIHPVYKEDGSPVFPEEFTPAVLQNLEKAKGPYEFGAQYLLNPTPEEHQRFKEEWFNYYDEMPNPAGLRVCITVDPAKSLEDHADNTAITVCGYDERNRMYLLDGRDEKLAVDELPELLFDMVRYWQSVSRFLAPVGFEALGFQETYVFTLERMMMERDFFFMIEAITHRSQSKDERILRLVPRVKSGFYVPRKKLVTPYGGRGPAYDLTQRVIWQLTRFPFAGKDDLADALADQLEIVKADRLPAEPREESKVVRPDFVHRSKLEDKKKVRRSASYNYGVVR
jgi:hypothetical protein